MHLGGLLLKQEFHTQTPMLLCFVVSRTAASSLCGLYSLNIVQLCACSLKSAIPCTSRNEQCKDTVMPGPSHAICLIR